jgi:hypothetical protein
MAVCILEVGEVGSVWGEWRGEGVEVENSRETEGPSLGEFWGFWRNPTFDARRARPVENTRS